MTFTDAETVYLASQRLERLATIGPDGSPQVKPVGIRYNPELGTIEVTRFNRKAMMPAARQAAAVTSSRPGRRCPTGW